MSIFIPNNACNQSYASPAHARREEFLRTLEALPSWEDKNRKIEAALQQTRKAFAAREERLLALRTDFDALTLAFWNEFARGLGCENPAQTIDTEEARKRFLTRLGTILFFVCLLIMVFLWFQYSGSLAFAVSVGVAGAIAIYGFITRSSKLIARARQVCAILKHEQEPFWLTGGSIALSNLSITPPPEAQWWTSERITFVFVRGTNPRFTIDALKLELIWEYHWDRASVTLTRSEGLANRTAAEILQRLIATNPRYRQLVKSFSSLASLESEITFVESLKAEADRGLFEELRAEELRAAQAESQRSQVGEGGNTSFDHAHSSNGKASWETLIISQSLRETLQAYCRILRDYTAYQEQGVHLPKGLLLFGPPGCGKTQIAKTLSVQAGLNFVALSTSDCKVGWIGHAVAKIASVFAEARAKQPTLLFIDELDAVCPARGAYHDCISQEVTAQLL
jgi:DNA replication protein DnaC